MKNSEGKAHFSSGLPVTVGIVLDAYFDLLLGVCLEIDLNRKRLILPSG